MRNSIGTITEGSLVDGLTMKVAPSVSLDTLKTGKFVSIICAENTFFCLMTDIALHVSNPDILLYPPTEKETLLLSLLKHRNMYATAQLKPMVMLQKRSGDIVPVKILVKNETLPQRISSVCTLFSWDTTKIEFIGINNTGIRPAQSSSMYMPGVGNINESSVPKDGNAAP